MRMKRAKCDLDRAGEEVESGHPGAPAEVELPRIPDRAITSHSVYDR